MFSGETMGRLLKGTLLTLILMSTRLASAQDLKIGVVDVQRLAVDSDEGKAGGVLLRKRYEDMSADLKKIQQTIDDNQNKLKTQDRLLSDAAKAGLNRTIDQQKTELDRKNQDYQKEFDEL